jgi:hypothetical protein
MPSIVGEGHGAGLERTDLLHAQDVAAVFLGAQLEG